MIQLGQSLFYKGYSDKEEKPAIYLGKNTRKDIILSVLDPDGTIKEVTCYTIGHCSPCRQKEDSSPTGMKIYFGGLAKGVYGDFKIKTPDEKLLRKEFEIIKTKSL